MFHTTIIKPFPVPSLHRRHSGIYLSTRGTTYTIPRARFTSIRQEKTLSTPLIQRHPILFQLPKHIQRSPSCMQTVCIDTPPFLSLFTSPVVHSSVQNSLFAYASSIYIAITKNHESSSLKLGMIQVEPLRNSNPPTVYAPCTSCASSTVHYVRNA